MRHMKIAYILSSLANSGPILVALDLARLMIDNGHDVDVFYFDDIQELDFPCPVHRISMRSRIDFGQYDIVHCHGVRPDLYVLLHKPCHCKTAICTTIHSYMFEDHAYKYGKWQSIITAGLVLAATIRDDKIILLSRHMQQYYKKYLPARKLTYAYNTRTCDNSEQLTKSEKEELLAFKGNDILICSVSGLHQRKGLHQIIQALPSLPGYKYCVVGDGLKRSYLENLARTLGVADRVLFVGSKPAGYRYLKYADIFVIPSYSEGFPLAMLEAASMGKAIVASDIPVLRELFSEQELAVFELDNIPALCDKLLYTYANRSRFEKNILARFLQTYSPKCFYCRHIEIYKDLISEKSDKYSSNETKS